MKILEDRSADGGKVKTAAVLCTWDLYKERKWGNISNILANIFSRGEIILLDQAVQENLLDLMNFIDILEFTLGKESTDVNIVVKVSLDLTTWRSMLYLIITAWTIHRQQ